MHVRGKCIKKEEEQNCLSAIVLADLLENISESPAIVSFQSNLGPVLDLRRGGGGGGESLFRGKWLSCHQSLGVVTNPVRGKGLVVQVAGH